MDDREFKQIACAIAADPSHRLEVDVGGTVASKQRSELPVNLL
ncbi:MAG: hypothetical protein QM778_30185 [Myxococcales bacterium]